MLRSYMASFKPARLPDKRTIVMCVCFNNKYRYLIADSNKGSICALYHNTFEKKHIQWRRVVKILTSSCKHLFPLMKYNTV